MSRLRPNVAVAGGSLGGLTAALTLTDVGCEVQIYERSHAPLEGRGAGIVLHPATIRYFVESGAMDVGTVSAKAKWLRYLDRDGATLHEEPCRYWFTSYYTLYQGLLSRFETSRYHLGAEMIGFEQDAKSVTLHLSGGRRVRAALLVCADGISSAARRSLSPEATPAYAGYVGWRGTVREDELSPETFELLHGAITYYVGPLTHILTYPIPDFDGSVEPGQRRINFVWYRNVAPGLTLDDLMTSTRGIRNDVSLGPGSVQPRHVEALFEAAGSELPLALAETVVRSREPFVQVVLDVAVARMALGRVCLVGDAAFAIRPHAAAGTAKAAEDAWALARAMQAAGGDAPIALQRWEPAQLKLGRQVLERARDIGDRSQVRGTYRPGDADLLFGLYHPGDSAMTEGVGSTSGER